MRRSLVKQFGKGVLKRFMNNFNEFVSLWLETQDKKYTKDLNICYFWWFIQINSSGILE